MMITGNDNMQMINLDNLPSHARQELLDFYEFLLEKYSPFEFNEEKIATQPRLGDLAIKLFGTVAGTELDLQKYPPHEPLEFEQ